MANYKLSYVFIFESEGLGRNRAKRTQPFEAENDEFAQAWARQYIAERNQLGEDGGDHFDFRGNFHEDKWVRRKGYNFEMTELVKIVL